jgi:DNA modification methylase
MNPDYQGNNWAIYVADCIEIMNEMPGSIVDLSIFSPPFSDLFVYSDSERDMGNCSSHGEFMDHYSYFAKALHHVTKPGRLACVHCSDLPARKSKDGFIGMHDFSGDLIRAHQDAGWIYHARCTIWKDPVIEMQRTKALGLLYKQLKKDSSKSRVGMPDYVLFFRKDGINNDPISHDPHDLHVSEWQELASPVWMQVNQTKVLNGRLARANQDERHICPLQLDVIERCLKLYSNLGDVILDPFNGIGSTGYQSIKMGRKYIGIELKPEYAKQASKFIDQAECHDSTLLDIST